MREEYGCKDYMREEYGCKDYMRVEYGWTGGMTLNKI